MLQQQQSGLNSGKDKLREELRRFSLTQDQLARDKCALKSEVTRLAGLVDHMQDEARDAVPLFLGQSPHLQLPHKFPLLVKLLRSQSTVW